MGPIASTVLTAAGLFAGTNIDGIVVLGILNATSRAAGRPKRWQIWIGQYAGIGAVTLMSVLAALGLTLIPGGWVWLLGWIPITLGSCKLIQAIRARKCGEPTSPAVATGLTGVVGLTIANGGDNLAAFIPLFHTISVGDAVLTLAVFAVLIAVWCAAGAWLVSHHYVTRLIQRWGHWIVPGVYILVGLYVFHKTGVFSL
ncbi:MAG: cadmium resistance transporter [Mycobacterium sp.]|nr:cadmium resistance transporter [Mycobacterium sp.]